MSNVGNGEKKSTFPVECTKIGEDHIKTTFMLPLHSDKSKWFKNRLFWSQEIPSSWCHRATVLRAIPMVKTNQVFPWILRNWNYYAVLYTFVYSETCYWLLSILALFSQLACFICSLWKSFIFLVIKLHWCSEPICNLLDSVIWVGEKTFAFI